MPTFDKLSGKNFTMWRFQMVAYLKMHQLMGVVDGTVNKPDNTDIRKFEELSKKDNSAVLAILPAIDSSQLEYVSSADGSATMWKNLLALYERIDPTSKINALGQYYSYRYDKQVTNRWQ